MSAASEHRAPRRAAVILGLTVMMLLSLLSPAAQGATVTTSIWPTTAIPSVAAADDPAAVELGVKFRADVAGTITGIRFYKGPGNSGTHIGKLWTSAGALLASVTFTNESASGWQQANFSSPVAISANTTYVASYWTSSGRYAFDAGYFAGRSFDRAPLHALDNGRAGGNGVYRYGRGGFPTSTWSSANYWVDVAFSYSAAVPPTTVPPTTVPPTTVPPTTVPPTTVPPTTVPPTTGRGVEIDASSPVQVTGTGIRTTPAFSPPSGSVLVALVSYDTGGDGANNQTISSSPPLAWTLKGRKSPDPTSTGGAGTDGGVEVWTATVAEPTPHVVINSQTRAHDGALKVLVVTGTEAKPSGAVAAASGAEGVPALTLTPTASSLVVAVSSDWAQRGLGTVGAAQTMIAEHDSPGLVTTHTWRRTQAATAGTPVSLNLVSPSSQRYNVLALELRPSAASSLPPLPATSTPTTTVAPPAPTTTVAPPAPTTTVAPPAPTTTVAPPAPTAGALSIRVAGNRLVNGSGSTVRLAGVNRSGGEYACVQGWGFWDGPMDLASVQAIKSWRTNAVRVPLNETCWLGINGVNPAFSGENYRAEVERYVNLLVSQGLYPILDLHWTAAGTARATGLQPMPNADHSPDFWGSVAQRFKGNPAVIFDLFNEPYPDNNSNSVAAWSCWKNGGTCPGVGFQVAGMQRLVDTVRSAGATNVIMLGGVQYSNSLSSWLAYKPTDPANQLAASFHTYDWNICNTEACWTSTVAPVAAQVPVVTGELGEGSGTANYTTAYLRWADARGISYLAWTWDTWGCGNGPVLISNYDGTPCVSFGSGYKAHLATLP